MGEEAIGSEIKGELSEEVDALYKLPLAEFIAARNNLAARLKRDGRSSDANLVKTFGKPSVSAWAVNQLHWSHREAYDRLLVTGQRLRLAQASDPSGRMADMRESLEARSAALSDLSDLAATLLREGGHNPSPDTLHRITTTLEALSAYAMLSGGPTPGRLTQDVDPPGFELLASLIPLAGTRERSDQSTRVTSSQESSRNSPQVAQASPAVEVKEASQLEEARRARIAAAKTSLQEAKRSLTEARSKAQQLEAALKRAQAEAREAVSEAGRTEKQLREAEERFKKASTISQDAAHRAQQVAAEAREAAQAVEEAKHAIEEASRELESLLL